MTNPIIECVPNFSEGRNPEIIKQITYQIEKIKGVKLLNVDSGKGTNRTVVTFVGDPDSVIEAAFRAIKKASEIIDMRNHKGEHPRMGATDVCPLVPISGITMEETVEYAHRLGYRVGEELGIPGYYYERAAVQPFKVSLSDCRSGEYEGLAKKFEDPEWKPDFGPTVFNPKTGATAIGARDFLVAYNINLNTTSTRRANAVAFDIREKGRVKRKGDPLTGEIEKDKDGNPVYIPGSLESVKAIGWYIEEYGLAQISLNLTNINITPIHIAFDEASAKAEARGLRVTGSELIGLVPLKAMLDAGKYFLKKQKRSLGVSEEELIRIAILSLGLNELAPFRPEERIIEYLLEENHNSRLTRLSLKVFANETASENPAPGGGSVAAYAAALGASLGAMVANLSAHKKGWDDRWEEFSKWAVKGQDYKVELLQLVDEDSKAFEEVMAAWKLPKESQSDFEARIAAINRATIKAIEVPYKVMKISLEAMELIRYSAENGLSGSISDAGVGALMANAAIKGAYFNVRINCKSLENPGYVGKTLKDASVIAEKATQMENEILEIIEKKLA